MQLSNISQSDIIFRSIQVPSRKKLSPLARYSPDKKQKNREETSKLRSSTSCSSYEAHLLSKRKKTLRRSTSVHSHIIEEGDFIPQRAKHFNEMVQKKRNLLRRKHKIKGASDIIPNILEIRQSVKKQEVSFIRRMDTKLNTNGNANLLINLKRDLRIKSHNYLREISEKYRRGNLNHIKKQIQQKPIHKQEYIPLQCNPLPHHMVTIQ